MQFACIKNGVVENTIIVENENLLPNLRKEWDHVIQIDDIDPMPSRGWSYTEGAFMPPVVEETPAENESPEET